MFYIQAKGTADSYKNGWEVAVRRMEELLYHKAVDPSSVIGPSTPIEKTACIVDNNSNNIRADIRANDKAI